MHRLISILFCILTALATAAVLPAKPNFSGNWKLNNQKSNLGPMPAPTSLTEKITHKDPDLTAATSSIGGPQGDLNYDVTYNTGGKETTNHFGDHEAKSTAKWDGDALSIDTKVDFGQGEMTIHAKWTLSPDGKVLTQTAHFDTPQGPLDLTYIFDKQ